VYPAAFCTLNLGVDERLDDHKTGPALRTRQSPSHPRSRGTVWHRLQYSHTTLKLKGEFTDEKAQVQPGD
jgi:hypothetical protein